MSVGIPEIFIILIFPVVLLLGIFWVWMLVDCATRERDPDRLVWIIIVFTNVLGTALCYFVQRSKRVRAA
jgi:uncharacterized membrane-anchored protein